MSTAPSVTVAPGVTVTAEMTPLERFNTIAKAHGAPTVERPAPVRQFHTDATIRQFEIGERNAAERAAQAAQQPREDGTVAPAQHAGTVAPTPDALAQANSLEGFDAEMRAKGLQVTPPPEDGRFQRDERTGHVVDTHALQKCNELFRALPPAEREAARAEYEETLGEIYAGKLQLSDMEGSTAPELPRDAQGRFAPSSPAAQSPYTPEQWEAGHASVADANGFIPLERLNQAGLSGFTLPKLVQGQTYHASIFGDLAWARANGITQKQVEAFIADGMRRQGLIR